MISENRKDVKISVIFPAYNEEENIEKSVDLAIRILPQISKEYEIIVINDGSKDGTGRILDKIALRHPYVRVIHHPKNLGYGAAVKSGIYASRYEFVFLCDSDLQFDLAEMPDMLKWITGYDLVIGYRIKRADHLQRRINAWGWRLLIRIWFGLNVKDIDCAFKLFNRSVFNQIELTYNGAMISTEILVQAQKYGFTIKEIPVSHYPRLRGKQTGANLKVILKAFRDLVKFHRRMKMK
jgi:glycosyltransferase involved in cell wall biosynthesis